MIVCGGGFLCLFDPMMSETKCLRESTIQDYEFPSKKIMNYIQKNKIQDCGS